MRNNYIKKTLKNGVKLYLYIDSNMKRTFVDYCVDYGSSGKWFDFYLDEKHYHVLPGCAHFLEHMLGEHSKYGNIYKYFSDKKYEKNAVTSDIRTHYYFCGTEDILDSIEKLINIVDDPVFTKEDVEQTKKAIIEETKRSLNNKLRISLAIYAKNMYKDLDLYHESLSSIGNDETTKKIDYDTLKACYDAFYYDENKTLLIAGNFDEKELTDYIESIYDKLDSHKKRLKEYEYKYLDDQKTKQEIYYMSTNDDFVTIGFKQRFKDFSKKEINYFLSFMYESKFSIDSKFVEKLKNENIISSFNGYTYSFINNEYYDFCIFVNAKNSDKLIQEMLKEIKENSFNKQDFNLFIRQIISNHARAIDEKYKEFFNFSYRRRYSDDFDDIDFLKTLTYDRFIEFYDSLTFDNYTIGIVRNKNS